MRRRLTAVEVAVLKALEEGRERASGVAGRTGLNVKTTWQALQRLRAFGLVDYDEKLGIYSLSERGRRVLEEVRGDELFKRYAEAELQLMRLMEMVRRRLLKPEELGRVRAFFEELERRRQPGSPGPGRRFTR